MSTDQSSLRDRLRTALRVAMKARERPAATALRSALAAIDNAEAVDAGSLDGGARAGAIENSAVGLGAAEVARRVLTEADIEAIVRAEITERHGAAAEYDELGRGERAAVLRIEAAALEAQLWS